MEILVAADADGRILHVAQAPDPTELKQQHEAQGHQTVTIGWDSRAYYVADGRLQQRPDSPVTVSAAKITPGGDITLSNVAEGAAVSITGPVTVSLEGDGNPIRLGFPLPGLYSIAVTNWPDRDAFFQLEVAE